MECLASTENILQDDVLTPSQVTHRVNASYPGPTAIFGRMGSDTSFKHSIPNAWMASTPGHSFFHHAIEDVRLSYARHKQFPFLAWPSAEEFTGPVSLRRSIHSFASMRDTHESVSVLPPHLVYPYDWKGHKKLHLTTCSARSSSFDADKCKSRLRGSRQKEYHDYVLEPYLGHMKPGACNEDEDISFTN